MSAFSDGCDPGRTLASTKGIAPPSGEVCLEVCLQEHPTLSALIFLLYQIFYAGVAERRKHLTVNQASSDFGGSSPPARIEIFIYGEYAKTVWHQS